MALGKTQGQLSKSIYVDLKFNATKGPAGVGFRQVLTKVPSLTEGKKYDYTYAMYDYVEGHISGLRVKEEPVYDKPNEKECIGYATLSDPAGGENVIVRFPLAGGAGRKLVGLLNTAKDNAGVVYLHTNMAEAGTVINDKTLEKPAAYLNMRRNDSKGERITPSYVGPDGQTLIAADGKLAQLAMGVKHVVGKNVLWDFTVADEMTLNTAAIVVEHFANAAEGDEHKHGEPHDDSSVDLNEAAQAAAPHG